MKRNDLRKKLNFGITSSEVRRRLGYIFIGFFTFYLVAPIREWVNANVAVNPILIGVGGIILSMYLFEY